MKGIHTDFNEAINESTSLSLLYEGAAPKRNNLDCF